MPGCAVRSSGSSRASSASHTSSSASSPDRTGSDRNQSTTGPHGGLPAASYARPYSTAWPSAATRRASSSTSRDLPMPASPVTHSRRARPPTASRHAAVAARHSRARPTRAGPVRSPQAGRRSCSASAVVAGSGVRPSSPASIPARRSYVLSASLRSPRRTRARISSRQAGSCSGSIRSRSRAYPTTSESRCSTSASAASPASVSTASRRSRSRSASTQMSSSQSGSRTPP